MLTEFNSFYVDPERGIRRTALLHAIGYIAAAGANGFAISVTGNWGSALLAFFSSLLAGANLSIWSLPATRDRLRRTVVYRLWVVGFWVSLAVGIAWSVFYENS